MKRVAILGASGYTGRELARWLAKHPELELDGFMSSREGVASEGPELERERVVESPGLALGRDRVEPLDLALARDRVEPLDWQRVASAQGVFLCTPHGTSAELARRCLELGAKVVDLSADFRLRAPDEYARTYGHAHKAPELLGEAVYGLTEHARDAVAAARIVANPGCYPTSILLPLLPLYNAKLIARDTQVIADAKSGVSGAGKTPSARTHFGAVHENFSAYGVGTHRHTPEIHQAAGTDRIVFVPHLLPAFRGILSTIYVTPVNGAEAAEVRACLQRAYSGERFVRVLANGLPELSDVQHTNECHIGVASCGASVVIVSAIDNLVKGASGQALQNMNLMLGCEESAGLA
jgi:N-acetyl-gamma-glutamyl-phosphate reductase